MVFNGVSIADTVAHTISTVQEKDIELPIVMATIHLRTTRQVTIYD